jgi:hypothetical protein
MPLLDDLRREIARRPTRQATKVFSVFNIGTGHIQSELNNTIAALGADCEDAEKVVNDGPTGAMGNFQGWGMNDALSATHEAIRNANPTHVNMTGHSRGAILCHMLAHAIYSDPRTRHIKINMIVLDPVHQSKLKHEGAEHLDDNPNLLTYHSIIMEHEDNRKFGSTLFPYKFVAATDSVEKRMHFINMPGKHGSGSQNLTSPIGKVVYELIANFMRTKRTRFRTPAPTPLDMCEYFAQIHLLNPLSIDGSKRLLFDDGGNTLTHDPKKQGVHGNTLRAADIARALTLNANTTLKSPGMRVMPKKPTTEYFFNAEHAYYFHLAFPFFFKVLAGAPAKTKMVWSAFDRDFTRLGSRPGLTESFPVLAAQMRPWLS